MGSPTSSTAVLVAALQQPVATSEWPWSAFLTGPNYVDEQIELQLLRSCSHSSHPSLCFHLSHSYVDSRLHLSGVCQMRIVAFWLSFAYDAL